MKKISLFWWSSVKFEGKMEENFGDILSKYIVEKISGKTVVWKNPSKSTLFSRPIYLATGSILSHVTKRCIVWGSGIISKDDKVQKARFLAVRDPETYNHLISMGYNVNKVFGDPAILLPKFFKKKSNKKYKLGIIPHYVDYERVNDIYGKEESLLIVNLLSNDIEAVVSNILSCEKVVTSSLHGLIVSHAYQIPAIWVEFSKELFGDGIKFLDYFKSVNLEPYEPKFIDKKYSYDKFNSIFEGQKNLPNPKIINKLSEKLIEVCPFKEQ